ncbi:MAG: DegT/DnrJ/EryC1/StrS family aminotransferase [Gammaproteobacteria bacterium]|nr:DegT/DnrJ/EryC1/StrS family aminotransferase [Gammaproteobacteria bacterium]
MNNILLDVNIILDYFSETRRESFPESVIAFDVLKSMSTAYISTSSLDNISYLKANVLRIEYGLSKSKRRYITKQIVNFLLKKFKMAKTPAYIEIDYDDIEDSQIIASAIAIDAQVVTRDKGMLEKYPDRAITTQTFLQQIEKQPEKIDFIDLKKQYFSIQPKIEKNMDEVLNSTSFIMGNKVAELEEKLADFVGVKYCIGVSSGTDALLLSMMALDIGPGDEVITTPFTFIATGEMIALLGAKPVFVDIDPGTYNIDPEKIEQAITTKTKAIMPVSLYGQCADFDKINVIAAKYQIAVIEDGAQSLGATYKGKQSCSLTTIGCTSFFPSKPLGGYGDGGACFTDNDKLAALMREIRVHGQDRRYHHPRIGINGRMDTLQAAVLLAKFTVFPEEVKKRRYIGETYTKLITENCPLITPPYIETHYTSVYAQYTIKVNNRDKIIQKLKNANIPTAVHYPVPLNQQPALETQEFDLSIAENLSHQVMSLPMHPYLTEKQQNHIVKALQI